MPPVKARADSGHEHAALLFAHCSLSSVHPTGDAFAGRFVPFTSLCGVIMELGSCTFQRDQHSFVWDSDQVRALLSFVACFLHVLQIPQQPGYLLIRVHKISVPV